MNKLEEYLSILPGMRLEEQEQERWSILLGDGRQIVLQELSKGVVNGLRILFAGCATQSQLEEEASAGGDIGAAVQLSYLLQRFRVEGLVSRDYWHGDRYLMRIEPTGRGTPVDPGDLPRDTRYRLRRFTLLRRDQRERKPEMLIESPLALCRVRVSDEYLARTMAALAYGATVEELHCLLPDLVTEDLCRLLTIMRTENLIEEEGAEESEDLRGWEVQDLYFHSRTRLGRSGSVQGATYRFAESMKPLPLLKPAMASVSVTMQQPNLSVIAARGRSLCEVLEARRSIREHGKSPISLTQLSEILFRTGRERSANSDSLCQTGNRPYPSGGALYELELYLAVERCQGLEPGLYHYRPLEHELTMIRGSEAVHAIAEGARLSLCSVCRPQVVVVITARFRRVNWKYESLAYALILKDVGVLMQTLYLVATDMGLAPCALGTGNSDLFAHVSGLDYLQETSVGEFALGSRPEEEYPESSGRLS